LELKLDKMMKNISNIKLKITTKEKENEELSHSIQDIKHDVETREQVKKSRDDARGKSSSASVLAMKRMKKVIARRSLIDTFRTNTEELELLRLELDKIRQKTFPSFVKAARQRNFANPDERI